MIIVLPSLFYCLPTKLQSRHQTENSISFKGGKNESSRTWKFKGLVEVGPLGEDLGVFAGFLNGRIFKEGGEIFI